MNKKLKLNIPEQNVEENLSNNLKELIELTEIKPIMPSFVFFQTVYFSLKKTNLNTKIKDLLKLKEPISLDTYLLKFLPESKIYCYREQLKGIYVVQHPLKQEGRIKLTNKGLETRIFKPKRIDKETNDFKGRLEDIPKSLYEAITGLPYKTKDDLKKAFEQKELREYFGNIQYNLRPQIMYNTEEQELIPLTLIPREGKEEGKISNIMERKTKYNLRYLHIDYVIN